MKIQVVDREGKSHAINWESRQLLMELLRDENFVLASCIGNCLCGTCHVWLDPIPFSKLGQQNEDEIERLRQNAGFWLEASRLSCQIRFSEELDGKRVVLTPYG